MQTWKRPELMGLRVLKYALVETMNGLPIASLNATSNCGFYK